jgi:Flp pilus assembly protein TadD
VELAPKAPNYHFALGIVLRIRGNQAEAQREFNQELALNPQHQAAAQQVKELRGASPAKSP